MAKTYALQENGLPVEINLDNKADKTLANVSNEDFLAKAETAGVGGGDGGITFDMLKEQAGNTTTTAFNGNTITETIKDSGNATVATRTTNVGSTSITENFIYYENGEIKINNTKTTTFGTNITEVVQGA